MSNLYLESYVNFKLRYMLNDEDSYLLANLIRFSNEGILMPKEQWKRWNEVGVIINKKVSIPAGMVVSGGKSMGVFTSFWLKCLLLYKGIMTIEEEEEGRRFFRIG